MCQNDALFFMFNKKESEWKENEVVSLSFVDNKMEEAHRQKEWPHRFYE